MLDVSAGCSPGSIGDSSSAAVTLVSSSNLPQDTLVQRRRVPHYVVVVLPSTRGALTPRPPVPAGVGGNFQARPEPPLLQDVAHMALDRGGADPQPVPDFLGAQTLANETGDFSLTHPHTLRAEVLGSIA